MRVILFSAALLVAAASPALAVEDQGGCASGFTVSGGFFSGKQYKTSSSLPGVSGQLAFKRAYASLIKKGYQIVESDKDVGVISASQQVISTSGGKVAPLNILVEPDANAGSKVNFTFSTAGGLMASEDGVRDEFCKITSDIVASSGI